MSRSLGKVIRVLQFCSKISCIKHSFQVFATEFKQSICKNVDFFEICTKFQFRRSVF